MLYKRQDFSKALISSTKRLLVPYIVFIGVGAIIDMVIWANEGNGSPFSITFVWDQIRRLLCDTTLGPIAACWFLISFFVVRTIDFRSNSYQGINYFLAVLYEVAGCIVFNNVFKKFLDFRIPAISHVGKQSLVYYVMHYPVMFAITTFFYGPFRDMSGSLRYIILSGILLLILILSDLIWSLVKGDIQFANNRNTSSSESANSTSP